MFCSFQNFMTEKTWFLVCFWVQGKITVNVTILSIFCENCFFFSVQQSSLKVILMRK